MPAAAIPENETNRILALHALNILDTLPEERFDRLTRLATKLFNVPVALVSLVDSDRQWFKSCQGLEISETPRSASFCAHTILQDEVFVIPDARTDSRFADNPLVTGEPHVVFYAGCPLTTADGSKVGTLCLIDHRPRTLTPEEIEGLKDLAEIAKSELQLAEVGTVQQEVLRQNEARLAEAADIAQLGYWEFDVQTRVFTFTDQLWALLGTTAEEQGGYQIPAMQYAQKFVHPDGAHVVGAEIQKAIETTDPNYVGQVEGRIIRADGSEGVIAVRFRVIKDEQGRTVKTVGINQDITERKLAEETLAKRAAELQTVAQVSAVVTTILDTDELLQEVVDLTKNSFNLYHAHIYLYDEQEKTLTLAAGAGEVGPKLVAQNWHIPLGREQSLVARAGRMGQGVIVNDVRQDPDFLANPLLPETRSEMAIPVMIGGQLLGVLDVQSEAVNHFTADDVLIKTTLADQIAVALQNADHYTQRKQAEEVIRQSEARLAEAADIAKMGYWELDVPTQMFTFTDQFYALLGTTAEEQGGYQMPVMQYAQQFVHPDDAHIVGVETQKAIETTDPNYVGQLEARVIRPDGSERVHAVKYRAVKDEQGRTVKTVGINQDITERKRSELALQESRKRLQTAASIAKLGYWDHNGETDLFTFDDHFYAMLHTTAEEQGGYQMSPAEYIDRFLHPDDVPLILEAFNKAVSSTGPEYNAPLEYRVRYADGGIGHVLVRILVLRDDEGRIILHAGTTQDITESKQAEEVIRQSEARLAEAADIAQLGYWEFDVQTQVFTFTDQLWAIFRTTAEEQGGYQIPATQYAQKFVHPDDANMVGAEIQKAIETTDPNYTDQVEHRIIRADGSEGVIAVRYRVVKDEQGRTVKTVGINQDITERKRMEDALLAREQEFRSLAESSPDFIIRYDAEQRMRYINGNMQRRLALDGIDELIGRRLAEVWPDGRFNVVDEAVERAIKSGNPVTFEVSSPIPGETGGIAYTDIYVVPERDVKGEVIGAITFSRNITERKQAEETIRQSEARLAEAADIAKMGHWEFDFQTQVFTVTDQLWAIFRTTAEEQGGYQMPAEEYTQKFVHPDDAYVLNVEIQKAIESTDPDFHGQVEQRIIRADGSVGVNLVRYRVIKDEQGRPVKSIGIGQDITERRQAEEALRQSRKRLSEALDVAKLAYWEIDVTTHTFTLNNRFYSLFGTTAEEQGGYQMSAMQFAQKFMHPDDIHIMEIEAQRAEETTDPNYSSQFEYRFLEADGRIRYIVARNRIHKDEQGRTVKAVGISQDITRRKQMENALAAREQEFRSLAESSPDFVIRYDAEQRMRYVNSNLARRLMIENVDEVLGRRSIDVWPDGRFAAIDEAAEQAIESGELVTIEIFAPTETGEMAYSDIYVVPERDVNGEIIGTITFERDITERKQAEEVIRQNEARLAEAAEIAKLGYWEFDFQTQVFTVTDQMWAMFRTTAEEQGGYQMPAEEYIQKFVHPDDAHIAAAEIQKGAESPEPEPSGQIEYQIIRADGSEGVHLVRYRVIKDEQGWPVKAIGIGQDITERKQAEEALWRNRQLLLAVMDNIPQAIFWKDHNLIYLGCNRVFAEDAGLASPKEIVGKTDYDLPSTAEEAELYRADDQRVLDSGTPKVNYEERLTLPTGTQVWLRTNKIPIRDAAGNITTILGTYEDITARKQAEETIRRSEARLSEAADIAQLGYWEFDFQTEMYTFTDQFYALLRTTVGEQGGYRMPQAQYVQKFIHPDDAYVVSADLQNYIETTDDPNYDGQFEHRGIRADGSVGYILVRYREIKDEQGRLVRTVGMNQDITARKQAEETLAKRAVELGTVAQVGTAASTILDTRQLLQRVVDLTKSRFGLYHTHIYLLNEAGDTLQLAAGAGEAGAKMVAQGWNIPLAREYSLAAQAARGRQGVIVNDVSAVSGFLPNPLLPETRSELAVPLVAGDQVLGVLDVQSDRLNYFSEEDINIQTTLAAQTAVALQNARLFTQSEKRAKELAFINRVVAEISTSDTKTGLQFLAEELGKILQVPSITIGLINDSGTMLELVAAHYPAGVPSPVGTVIPVAEDPVMSRALQTRQPVVIEDVANNADLPPHVRETVLKDGIQAMHVIPMLAGRDLIGTISLNVMEEDSLLTPDQLELAETAVHQASTAVQNARLFTQSETRAKELALINRIVTQMNTIQDINASLQFLVEELGIAMRVDSVVANLINAAGTAQEVVAAYFQEGMPDPVGTVMSLEGDPLMAHMLETRQTLAIDDVAGVPFPPEIQEAILQSGIRSLYLIPMFVGRDLIGLVTIGVLPGREPLTPEQVRLAETLTFQAGAVVQTIRLYVQAGQRAEELAFINRIVTEINAVDIKTGLQFMAEELGKILQIPLISIGLTDDAGAMMEIVAAHHPASMPSLVGIVLPAAGDPVADQTLQNRQTFIIEDVANSSDLILPHVREMLLQLGVRSIYTIPMLVGRDLIGMVSLSVMEGGSWLTSEQLKLAETAVHQASTGIQNARLFEQVQTAFRQVEQSEARLAEAADMAQLGYWEFDVQTQMFTLTNQFYALLRTSVEEQGGYQMPMAQYVQDFVHPNDLSQMDLAMQKAMGATERNYAGQVEHRIIRADGSEGVVAVKFRVIKDEQGQTVKTAGTNQDITERKQAEEQITKQANELLTVAEVSTAVTSTLAEQELLQTVVDLTQERFSLHHAHLYLLDETGEYLKLTAGSDEAGRTMVSRGWQISLNQKQSIVALAAQNREASIANDVLAAADYMPNLLLSDTRSEMAVPLIASGELLGVLDVQHVQAGYFTEKDKQTQMTLASQVAVAVQNVRLYEQTQAALAELEAIQRRYTIKAWGAYSAKAQEKGFEKVDETIAPLDETHLPAEVQEAVAQKRAVVKAGSQASGSSDGQSTSTRMVVPLTVRDVVIGVLGLEDPTDNQPWTVEEVELVEAIVEQMAQTAENLRLFEEVRQKASQEQTIREITDKLRASPNLGALLETAARELGQRLGVRHTVLELGIGPDEELSGDPSHTLNGDDNGHS